MVGLLIIFFLKKILRENFIFHHPHHGTLKQGQLSALFQKCKRLQSPLLTHFQAHHLCLPLKQDNCVFLKDSHCEQVLILLGKELNMIYDSQAHKLFLSYPFERRQYQLFWQRSQTTGFDGPQGEILWINQTSERDFRGFNVA